MNQLRTIGAAVMARHGFFSIDQIMAATKISRKYCRDVLNLFCQEGLVQLISKGRKEHVFGMGPVYAAIYRVIDRKKLVARVGPRQLERTVQDRIWYVMRNKFKCDGSFSLRDLMILSGEKKTTIRWYLKALRRAGYIAPSRSGGAPGVEWRLTGNFGPGRPCIVYSEHKKKGVKNALIKVRKRVSK